MNEIARVLRDQADRVTPKSDLDDVLRRAHHPPRKGSSARVVAIAIVVVVGGGVAAVVATISPRPGGYSIVASTAPPPADIGQLGGLDVPDLPPELYVRSTIERSDPAAADGPQSIVVRRVGGTITNGTAVVTFPAQGIVPADDVIETRPLTGAMTIAMTQSAGRLVVRGVGLTTDEVRAIAQAIEIDDGRPVFDPGSNLSEFEVVAAGSHHPQVIRQARHGCADLGEADLGSLCYTGLSTSLGFEDTLYSRDFQPGPAVNGRPSVISTVGGGSLTLAWETQPGVIAYVGYSGNDIGEGQIAALHRFAERAALIPPTDWSQTQPQVVTQTNDWS